MTDVFGFSAKAKTRLRRRPFLAPGFKTLYKDDWYGAATGVLEPSQRLARRFELGKDGGLWFNGLASLQ